MEFPVRGTSLAAIVLVAVSATIHLILGVRAVTSFGSEGELVGPMAVAFIVWGVVVYGLVAAHAAGVVSPRIGAGLLAVAMVVSIAVYVDWHVVQWGESIVAQTGIIDGTSHEHTGHDHGNHDHASPWAILLEHLRDDAVALGTKAIEATAVLLFLWIAITDQGEGELRSDAI